MSALARQMTRCDMVRANRMIIEAWLLDSDESAEDAHVAMTLHWCLNEGTVSAEQIRGQARDQYDSATLFPASKRDRNLCHYASETLQRLADKLHSYPSER